jgi:hypothetical protein
MRQGRAIVTVLAIGGLLLGTLGLAQGRFGIGPHGTGGPAAAAAAFGQRGAPVGNHAALLQRLPIGTTVTATLFDGDPESGAEAITTLTITIGEASEAAFAQELQAAQEGAAFLRYDIGEATRTIALGDDAGAAALRRGPAAFAFGSGIGVGMHAMHDGDAMTIDFYADDPAAGAEPVQTLRFTQGVDSAPEFAQALHAAAADAAYAVATTGPRSITVDLGEAPARLGRAPFGGQPEAWQHMAESRMAERQSAQRMERMQRDMPGRGGPRR